MKFKYLIIAFSIIIVIIILVTVLLPLVLVSSAGEITVSFRYITLPLLIFMALLLGSLGIFLFFNYRLLSLLDREDWPALAYYLEQKIYVKGRFSRRNVRILASSYLVMTDYQSVIKLENKAILAKPSTVENNILLFGAARVLSGSPSEAVAFFKTHLEKGKIKAKDEQWIRWYYGFSLLLSGSFSMVLPEFASLAISSRDALITGLPAYFLNNTIAKNCDNSEEGFSAAKTGRTRVVKALKNLISWKKETNNMSADIHVAIIKKYINEAGEWLFGEHQ